MRDRDIPECLRVGELHGVPACGEVRSRLSAPPALFWTHNDP